MKSEMVIQTLNRLLEGELMALEFYRIHAEAIPEERIVEGVQEILPAEHAHAVALTTRINELGGDPAKPGGEASRKGQEMGESSRAQGTVAILKLELEQEQHAIIDYAEVIAGVDRDIITLEMLEEQLFDEMRHAKWLKQTLLDLQG